MNRRAAHIATDVVVWFATIVAGLAATAKMAIFLGVWGLFNVG